MNNVTVGGRLTRDPEIQWSNNQNGDLCIARFGIAVRRRGADEEPDFFSVTAFGAQAENIAKFIRQGDQVFIAGRLRHERWVDDQGNNRSAVGIIADNVEFGRKAGDGQESQNNSNNQSSNSRSSGNSNSRSRGNSNSRSSGNSNSRSSGNSNSRSSGNNSRSNKKEEEFMYVPYDFENDLPFT